MGTLWLVASVAAEGNDFAVIGWYVGSHNQLPYTDQPRVFYMEKDVSNPDQYLRRAGPNLGWGQYHTLSIWPHNPGSIYNDYYFFVDGTFRTSTVYLHQRYNNAILYGIVYNGGADPYCTEMYAYAQASRQPWVSVQACSNGANPPPCNWHYFYDRYYNHSPYYAGQLYSFATALAWGPDY